MLNSLPMLLLHQVYNCCNIPTSIDTQLVVVFAGGGLALRRER
jgi:hypothetical protein